MNEQYARYEVPIWEAGWAKAQLAAAGVPIVTTARQGNIIVIVIPAQFAEFNHHTATATHRQRARGPVPKWAVLSHSSNWPATLWPNCKFPMMPLARRRLSGGSAARHG